MYVQFDKESEKFNADLKVQESRIISLRVLIFEKSGLKY